MNTHRMSKHWSASTHLYSIFKFAQQTSPSPGHSPLLPAWQVPASAIISLISKRPCAKGGSLNQGKNKNLSLEAMLPLICVTNYGFYVGFYISELKTYSMSKHWFALTHLYSLLQHDKVNLSLLTILICSTD